MTKKYQEIILKCGLPVTIDYDSKHKCKKCDKEIFFAIVPIELVGLAEWDIHREK